MTNPTGPSILEQLNEAWREKEWTVEELSTKSGLGLERTTMGKKMTGKIPLKDREIQALATCLERTIVWPAPAEPADDTESATSVETTSIEDVA